MKPINHSDEIAQRTAEAVQRSAEAAAHRQIETTQEHDVHAKFEQIEQATPLLLQSVEEVSRQIGMQEPTYTRNNVTSSEEPIKPEFGRILGYRKPVERTKFRPGVVGFETQTSKIVPIGALEGSDLPGGESPQQYVEFFVIKEVVLRRKPRSRKVERVTTDAVSYGVRLYAGPKGLEGAVSTKDLVAKKRLVPVISETETTVDVSRPLKGDTQLARIASATPNLTKMPGAETVTLDLLLDAVSQAAGGNVERDEAERMLKANPALKRKLAAQVIRQMVDQHGGIHQLAMDNASAHADAELRKLSLIAYLTEEAKKAA